MRSGRQGSCDGVGRGPDFSGYGRFLAKSRSGFSLVELLTVLGIISALAVVGLIAVRGISSGASVKGAVSTVSSLTLAAREKAKTLGLGARLVIDADATDPLHYYRRITVLEASDPDGDPSTDNLEWSYSTKPTLLPEGVYFYEDYSSGYGTMSFDFDDLSPQDGTSGDEVIYYEFDGNGRFKKIPPSGGVAQMVFGRGVPPVGGGTFSIPEDSDMELSRDGFIIHQSGRLTFFEAVELITPTTNP